MQTESAYYLEAGARTRVLVPQRLNVRLSHSLLPRSVTRATSVPGPMVRPSSGGHVTSWGACMVDTRASIFSRSFLLQPRPIDDVYRWVRIDLGVHCLYALRNRSILSGKAQKAGRRSPPSIDQPGEHSRSASVACLSTVRTCSSLLLRLPLDRQQARDRSLRGYIATSP